ncbi:MAG: TIM barrel protein [Spirochaetota bacterium]
MPEHTRLPSQQFGIPTLMEMESISGMIGLAREVGAGFIELNTNFPLYLRENLLKDRVLEQIEAAGLACSVHLPEPLDLGSFQEELRRAAVEMIANLVEIVPGKTRFIAHMNSGIPVSLPGEQVYLYDRWSGVFEEALKKSAEELELLLGDKQCRLCVENIGNFSRPYIQQGLQVLLEQAHIGLIWDFGHDTTAGRSDTPVFEQHLDQIWELHLHDSHEGHDHLPLFQGETDKQKAIDLAASKCLPIVVEVKTSEGVKESFEALRAKQLIE